MAATKGAGNIAVTYNSNAIDAYLDQAELNATVAELEATNLDSAAEEYGPGLPSWTLSLTAGNWAVAFDTIFGPDVITPTKRTVVIAITDSTAAVVTYTWTSNGFITGYNPGGAATGKLSASPQLRLSGNPSRGVA